MTSINSSRKSRTVNVTEPEIAFLRTAKRSMAVINGPEGETIEGRIDRWRSIYHAGQMPEWMIERMEMISGWSWGPAHKSGLRRKMAVAA